MKLLGHSIGQLRNYQVTDTHIFVQLHSGHELIIYLDNLSGMPYTRLKRDAVMNVEHPGIRLGLLEDRTEIIAHNHIRAGAPTLATRSQYAQHMRVRASNQVVNRRALQVVKSAMRQVCAGRPYDVLNYNCQHFVSCACTANSKSPTVRQMGETLGATALFFGALSLIAGARALNMSLGKNRLLN